MELLKATRSLIYSTYSTRCRRRRCLWSSSYAVAVQSLHSKSAASTSPASLPGHRPLTTTKKTTTTTLTTPPGVPHNYYECLVPLVCLRCVSNNHGSPPPPHPHLVHDGRSLGRPALAEVAVVMMVVATKNAMVDQVKSDQLFYMMWSATASPQSTHTPRR